MTIHKYNYVQSKACLPAQKLNSRSWTRVKAPSIFTILYVAYCVASLGGGAAFFYMGSVEAAGDQERGGPPASGVTVNDGRWINGRWESNNRRGGNGYGSAPAGNKGMGDSGGPYGD